MADAVDLTRRDGSERDPEDSGVSRCSLPYRVFCLISIDLSNSLISDWINDPKFSCIRSIRIMAYNVLRGPDRVPDNTKFDQ